MKEISGKSKYVLFLFFLASFSAIAQKQAANWYFSDVGLDFNSGIPVAIDNINYVGFEGTATISNSLGELLFYTDGIVVYNKNHQLMQNGTGLLGDRYSTQSAIIVPAPGSADKYYLFTTDTFGGSNGLNYSVVDMTLDGGLGGVVPSEKNIQLVVPVTEKLAAVFHENNEDIWVIAHRSGSDEFLVYLVTATGVSPTPVTSAVGEIYDINTGDEGYLKVSPDGTKLACAKYSSNANNADGGLDLFDFDTAMGVVSNPQELNNYKFVYGVEFSPNSQILYCSQTVNEQLLQYDITLSTIQGVRSSKVNISSPGDTYYDALQLGIDGKIYVNERYDQESLSIINNPNSLGLSCNFKLNDIHLIDGMHHHGLPNFISSYFLPLEQTIYACSGNAIVLESRFPNAVDYIWHEFNVATNNYVVIPNENTMSLNTTNAGVFKVKTIDNLGAVVEEVFTVVFSPSPVVDLGPDVCGQSNIALNGTVQNPNDFGAITYKWFDENGIIPGEIQSTMIVSESGKYTVEATGEILDENGNPTGSFCTASDEIVVVIFSLDLEESLFLCDEDSYIINPGIIGEEENASFSWSTGETTPTITVDQNGSYTVTVTINACAVTESIEVFFNETPIFSLPEDMETCDLSKLNLTLDATPSNVPVTETNFKWSFNGTLLPMETGATLLVDEFGTYAVKAYTNDPNCFKTEEITIGEKEPIQISILTHDRDNLFCTGETITLNAPLENATADEVDFIWFKDNVEIFGEETSSLKVYISENMPPTRFRVEATVDECFAESETSIGAYRYECNIPQGISPNGDPFNQKLDLSFLKVENLKIFNRYGRLVFQKENGYVDQWEGQGNNGGDLPTGTYFYIIELEEGTVFNSKRILNGWIYINR